MIKEVVAVLANNRDDLFAAKMKSYMKENFDFYGIKAPRRKELTKSWIKDHHKTPFPTIKEVVLELWDHPYREAQYLAMSLLDKHLKHLQIEDHQFLKQLVITKPWWDTVDWLASHGVGKYLKLYPDQIHSLINEWSTDNDIWLNRSTLIYQLFYKKNTDHDLLAALILQHIGSKEFFINKAAGWALRQYSKTNSSWVEDFIETHRDELNNLTIREGLKWIKNNR